MRHTVTYPEYWTHSVGTDVFFFFFFFLIRSIVRGRSGGKRGEVRGSSREERLRGAHVCMVRVVRLGEWDGRRKKKETHNTMEGEAIQEVKYYHEGRLVFSICPIHEVSISLLYRMIIRLTQQYTTQ